MAADNNRNARGKRYKSLMKILNYNLDWLFVHKPHLINDYKKINGDDYLLKVHALCKKLMIELSLIDFVQESHVLDFKNDYLVKLTLFKKVLGNKKQLCAFDIYYWFYTPEVQDKVLIRYVLPGALTVNNSDYINISELQNLFENRIEDLLILHCSSNKK